MRVSLTKSAVDEIKVIQDLSQKLARIKDKSHSDILLELMRKHIDEILLLYKNKDKHYLVETGDLLILCLELLLENRRSPDSIMSVCYRRYRRKLKRLLKHL